VRALAEELAGAEESLPAARVETEAEAKADAGPA